MNEDVISLVRRAVDAVEPLVSSVSSTDHDRRTPCEDFNLAALVAHLIGGLRGFAEVAEGKQLRFGAEPDLRTESAADEFRAAADRFVAGFGTPGTLERTFAMPWGDTTGMQLAGFELIELIVHGWDISRSLGRPADFDNDLVGAALFGAQQWVDDSTRSPQLFGPEVPVADDAPVLDRLVGFLGRQPAWIATEPSAPAPHGHH
jgi:uncharacterized protein (TIGR03086 family)